MAEIEKHLEQAEKYLQKGKSEAALREYLQVLQVSPEHEMANQAAASLFQALGRGGEAVRLWGNLFERYAAQGQTAAAMAAYRKLAEVAPPPPERILMLARLLESESPKEAVEQINRDATSAWMLAGRNREALEAWEGVVRLARSVVNLRQLGELAVKAGDVQYAATAFLQAGALASQDTAQAALVRELYQLAYELDRSNVATAVTYAQFLLQPDDSGDAPRVVELLRPFSAGSEATPESRALYGRALLASGQTSAAEPFLWELFEQEPGQNGRPAENSGVPCWPPVRARRRSAWRAAWRKCEGRPGSCAKRLCNWKN